MGAVVSEYFVLTAAHCFTVDDQTHSIKVSLGKDDATNQFRALQNTTHLLKRPVYSSSTQPPPLHPRPVRDGEDLELGMTWGQK